jgi:sterol desaturase/sphingolipid hydroxylase (fatty acid hydroxylase superfamily)
MAAAALGLFLAERHWPLRRQTQSGRERWARNVTLGAMSMAVVALVQTPLVQPLARQAEGKRRGLVQRLPLPGWARDAAAFLLMDYTIYLWHVAAHRDPFLWRFHLVHHLDLDLDSTTALRFHAADMAISIPYRALQVALIGTSPRALRVWQAWFFLSVLFHHSNVRLPTELERLLARLLTTPRMHGVHHMAVREAADSNWSSGLSLWDHVHGTFRWEADQRDGVIGVPGYRSPAEARLLPSLTLPFRAQREAWAPEARSQKRGRMPRSDDVPLPRSRCFAVPQARCRAARPREVPRSRNDGQG